MLSGIITQRCFHITSLPLPSSLFIFRRFLVWSLLSSPRIPCFSPLSLFHSLTVSRSPVIPCQPRIMVSSPLKTSVSPLPWAPSVMPSLNICGSLFLVRFPPWTCFPHPFWRLCLLLPLPSQSLFSDSEARRSPCDPLV